MERERERGEGEGGSLFARVSTPFERRTGFVQSSVSPRGWLLASYPTFSSLPSRLLISELPAQFLWYLCVLVRACRCLGLPIPPSLRGNSDVARASRPFVAAVPMGLRVLPVEGACTCIAHAQHSPAGAQTHRVCQSDALESALTRKGARARHPRAAQETPVGRWAERAADRFEECTVVQGDLVGARVRSKAWPEASALAER